MPKQALLIIDVQKDYFPNGKLPLYQPEQALAKVKAFEEKFLSEKLPIIYIQHIKHQAGADFFEVGTSGAELHPELAANESSIIIEKHYPNSFLETDLQATLESLEIDQLVITGMMTHMCVDSTTRAARELNYQPILISDATATKALADVPAEQVQTAFITALQNFAQVQTTAEFLSKM